MKDFLKFTVATLFGHDNIDGLDDEVDDGEYEDNVDIEEDDDLYNNTSSSNSNPSFQRHGCWEDCGNKTHGTLVALRIVKTGS